MKYVIEFDAEQLKTIILALQELPYKASNPIINGIITQASKQEEEAAVKVKEKEIKKSKE